MRHVHLVRRNRYVSSGYVIQKYGSVWRVSRDDSKRRGCLTAAQDVLYQSQDLALAIDWLALRN